MGDKAEVRHRLFFPRALLKQRSAGAHVSNASLIVQIQCTTQKLHIITAIVEKL